MCEKCLAMAKKYYPDLPEDDLGSLLMGATAYPFCDPEYLGRQLKETREATDGSLNQALGYAEYQMDMEAKRYRSWDSIKAQPFYA